MSRTSAARSWVAAAGTAALAAAAISGCATPPPARPIPVTAVYPGTGTPYIAEVGAGRFEPEERTVKILVTRAEPEGAPDTGGKLGPVLDESSTDYQQARTLAMFAQFTIHRQLEIPPNFGLHIVIFPMTEDRSAQLRTEISSTYGFAIGVPSIGGSITPRHQSLFLYQLVLRYLEMYMTTPGVSHGAEIMHRDERNRWVADGFCSLAGMTALRLALRYTSRPKGGAGAGTVESVGAGKGADGGPGPLDGESASWDTRFIDLAPVSYVEILRDALKNGRTELNLAETVGVESMPTASLIRERAIRIAAAEYLCYRWYEGARRAKIAHPLKELLRGLRGFVKGPTYEELTGWMQRVSGVNVAVEARRVLLSEVLEYHRHNWATLGWKAQQP